MNQEKKQDRLEPSFLAIVMMLSGSAANYLAEAADEQKKEEKKKNLELAQYVIDLISLLEEKTAGNLAEHEKKAIETVLADLRLQYIKVAG